MYFMLTSEWNYTHQVFVYVPPLCHVLQEVPEGDGQTTSCSLLLLISEKISN